MVASLRTIHDRPRDLNLIVSVNEAKSEPGDIEFFGMCIGFIVCHSQQGSDKDSIRGFSTRVFISACLLQSFLVNIQDILLPLHITRASGTAAKSCLLMDSRATPNTAAVIFKRRDLDAARPNDQYDKVKFVCRNYLE